MPKYQKVILLSIFGVLLFAYNDCGKVQFSNSPVADEGTTSAGGPTGSGNNPPATGCVSSSFGSLCSGTPPTTPPNTGAHGFFYNLTPIPDPTGRSANTGNYSGQSLAGSMSLLNSQSVIPNLSLYATEINVVAQPWTQGFPGYPNLQEWFGVCYDGAWTAPSAGSYTFVTAVDDAVAILIDGNLVGENDDGNVSQIELTQNIGANYNPGPVAFAPVTLAAGPHTVEILFYQAWPTVLEDQVWVYAPGTSYAAGSTPPASNYMQLSSPINGVLNCPH